MMWVDTTLAGLMSGVQSMVGTERFGLALQSEGRKSVEDDWQVISQYSDFQDGFKAIANIAAVAGWGDWEIISLDENKKKCQIRVKNSWEGRYQKSLGVCWNSGMLAGKMAGYCSKLFKTNCWAKQTSFIAKGDDFDEFEVAPSERSIEMEIENLLSSDEATRADMAVALQKLRDSEERYRMLADNIIDVIWLRDMNLNLKYISPSVMNQLGYTVEEARARTPEENWTPDSFKHVKEVFLEELEIEKNPQKDMHRSRTVEVEINCKGGSTIRAEAKMTFLRDKDGEPIGIIGVTRDITERKEAEEALKKAHDELKKRTRELEIKKNSLEELNTAMKVLLKKREEDKTEIESNVLTNVKELIEPYFEKIKKTKLDDQQKALLSIMESNVNEIISPFIRKMSLKYLNLTPTEIQIANLIRHGSMTKEIAELMNISPKTVETHRRNIRRKIGLDGKQVNLRSHLFSLH
jgi:PAS domain S-box-containing protein